MSTPEDPDIDTLKILQTPKDVLDAVLNISRKHKGYVLVHMITQKEGEENFWFNPDWMQKERDRQGSNDNTYVKFMEDVNYREYRISDIRIVTPEIDKQWDGKTVESPYTASKRILNDEGYVVDDWGYTGVFKKQEIDKS